MIHGVDQDQDVVVDGYDLSCTPLQDRIDRSGSAVGFNGAAVGFNGAAIGFSGSAAGFLFHLVEGGGERRLPFQKKLPRLPNVHD